MGVEEGTVKELLYGKTGMKWVVEIWKEFERGIKEARGEEERGLGWGYGEIG